MTLLATIVPLGEPLVHHEEAIGIGAKPAVQPEDALSCSEHEELVYVLRSQQIPRPFHAAPFWRQSGLSAGP